jgi:subtilase family serine protease
MNISKLFGKATILVACAAVMVASAAAQTIALGNPNVFVPATSKPKKGHPSSLYLIWKGKKFFGHASRVEHYPLAKFAASTIPGFHPTDIRSAYGLTTIGGAGAIAIVDENNLTSSLSDFNTFSQQFGLPQEPSTDPLASSNKVFQVVYAEGTKPVDDNTGWGGEIALDIEWAHAMAPNAKIYLVESTGDLAAANLVASKLPGVMEVSNSWIDYFGYPTETQDDKDFLRPGVTFFAGSGDAGNIDGWPSESPNIISCGGTSMNVDSNGNITSETAWSGSGGGLSPYESRPDYQNVIAGIVGSQRGSPDVAGIADPQTGVAVYSSTAYGNGPNWIVIGGTSVATPVMAGLTNLRGNYTNPVNYTSSSHRELQRIYFNLGGQYYRDVIGGSSGFNAVPGWDLVTGIGAPNGMYPNFVPAATLIPKTIATLQGAVSLGTIQNVKTADSIDYIIASQLTSLGQTSTIQANFQMGIDLSQLSGARVTIVSNAPLGTTIQTFAYNWTTKTFDYITAAPSTGVEGSSFFNLNSTYIQAGTRNVQLAYRAIRPAHISTGTFPFMIDQLVLQEQTVSPWDVNLPL